MLRGPQGHWFRAEQVNETWKRYCAAESDNSFYVWQWLSLAMLQSRFSNR
jgi:hypothetical protein